MRREKCNLVRILFCSEEDIKQSRHHNSACFLMPMTLYSTLHEDNATPAVSPLCPSVPCTAGMALVRLEISAKWHE